MLKKSILLACLITVCFVWNVKAQYASIDDATKSINTTLAEAPNGVTLAIDNKGKTIKKDGYGVTYEFNINDVAVINYENDGPRHVVKFACATGSKCFYSDDNFGGGVLHYLEVNSKEEADEIVAAFEFIREKVSYYYPK